MTPLTKRQRQILDFIGRHIKTHGFAPSLEEIADAMGLSSLATVHKHLENLRTKRYIRRLWNRSRSIELIVGPGCCPTCGRELETEGAKIYLDSAMKVAGEGVDFKAVEKGLAGPIPT